MTDAQLKDKLKIKPADRVLDIGGSLNQHREISVDTLVDLYPPQKAPYWPSKLAAKHFVQRDICRQALPFKNKEFDVCLCTHTLEDLYNPFLVMDEMSRVARRGYIATPSRGKDMEFSHYNLTDWLTGARRQPGLSHHHWFFEAEKSALKITPKIYPLLYTSEFFITNWKGEAQTRFFWEGKITYSVVSAVDQHKLIAQYREFLAQNKDQWERGPVLFYVDSPIWIVKEWAKKFLGRGQGYVFSKKQS